MAIDIKKSKVGSLHRHLGVAKDKKIPRSRLTIKSTDSPAIRKKKQFAINARKWKHEDGGLVEYGAGGTISSIGGVMGAIPTPWTQIGGAALSLIGGLVSGSEERKAAEEERIAGVRNKMSIGNTSIAEPMSTTFALGGLSGGKPIEVEGGEVVQHPKGNVKRISGPSHEQGGVPVLAQPGTRVFSDTLINPETGNTFAKDADILRKQLGEKIK